MIIINFFINWSLTNKLDYYEKQTISLIAAFGLVATVHAVEIDDKISINGFIDGSWTDTDKSTGDENDLDIDEVELNFIVNARNVSGEIHIDDNDPGSDLDNIEQAHFTYTMGNGLSVTLGRFGFALGFEGEDPAGLYTFSRAYDDNVLADGDSTGLYNLGNTDVLAVEGLSFGYSADAFTIALSVLNEIEQLEEQGANNDDLDLEVAITYTDIEDLVIGAGIHSREGLTAADEIDVTNLHAAYSMVKLMVAGEYVNVDTQAVDRCAYLIFADYDIKDRLGVAARYSQWESLVDGTELDRVTIAPNYAITESLGAILEYSSTETAAGTDEDQLAL